MVNLLVCSVIMSVTIGIIRTGFGLVFVLEINWDDVFSERSGMNDPLEAHGIGMCFFPIGLVG